jgi:hypothetical protein
MHRIERQQVRRGLGAAGDFVHLNELQIRTAPAGTQSEPPHSAEPVDTNSRGHETPAV